jgi:hypothetical protein
MDYASKNKPLGKCPSRSASSTVDGFLTLLLSQADHLDGGFEFVGTKGNPVRT